jgi:hypothetical protein
MEPGHLMLVTELCARGNVSDLLYKSQPVPSLVLRMRMAKVRAAAPPAARPPLNWARAHARERPRGWRGCTARGPLSCTAT